MVGTGDPPRTGTAPPRGHRGPVRCGANIRAGPVVDLPAGPETCGGVEMGSGVMNEVEKLLQGMAEKALPEDVLTQLVTDMRYCGRMYYRLNDEGMVERIDPTTVVLDTDS